MSKILCLLSIACLSIANDVSAADACEGEPASGKFQSCVKYQLFKERDEELNRQYQKRLSAFIETNATREKTLLIAAQRAWIRYKEETCRFEAVMFGTQYSKGELECLVRVTDERIVYLEYLNEFG